MAFAGITSELAEKIDISSSGLLTKLADMRVISRKQRQHVEVSALFSCDRHYVL